MIKGPQRLASVLWENLLKDAQPSVLVLWLEDVDLEGLAFALDATGGIQQIYLSYNLLQEMPPALPKEFHDKVYFTYPFAAPEQEIPRRYRVRAWLRSRGGKRTHERIQFNTHQYPFCTLNR